MAQKVLFKRKTTEEIDDLEIEDGSLIYNIENGKTYMDYGTQRIPTGGGANGGIYVGDTEPTDEDITLWVNTNTSETKASEIVDEYTESDKVGYSCDYINNRNTYSTDETFTGKHWINGKKIYRKVYSLNLPSSSGWNAVATINNVDTIIEIGGSFKGSDGRQLRINHPERDSVCMATYLNNKIEVKLDAVWYNKPAYIIVDYTKTTD